MARGLVFQGEVVIDGQHLVFPDIVGCARADRRPQEFKLGPKSSAWAFFRIDETGFCNKCGQYHFKVRTVKDPAYNHIAYRERPTMRVTDWNGYGRADTVNPLGCDAFGDTQYEGFIPGGGIMFPGSPETTVQEAVVLADDDPDPRPPVNGGYDHIATHITAHNLTREQEKALRRVELQKRIDEMQGGGRP